METHHFDANGDGRDALALELGSWVEAILEDKQPVVDGQAGLRALRAASWIMEAIQPQATNNGKI